MALVIMVSFILSAVGTLLLLTGFREFFWPQSKSNQDLNSIRQEAIMLEKQGGILLVLAGFLVVAQMLMPALVVVPIIGVILWFRAFGPRLTH